MKVHLVEPTVSGLGCPTGRPVIEYVDTALPNFRLRVFPTGRKVWAVYHYSDGRRRWVQLRPAYPHLGAEEARLQATALRKGTGQLPPRLEKARQREAEPRQPPLAPRWTPRSQLGWHLQQHDIRPNIPIPYRAHRRLHPPHPPSGGAPPSNLWNA